EFTCQNSCIRNGKYIANGGQKELKRREALLPVNDIQRLRFHPEDRDGASDYRTQEVRLYAGYLAVHALDSRFVATPNILPQRHKVGISLPDVRALVEGDEIAT